MELGKLEQVDLRTVWSSEAGHFSPWLAKEDNLTLLADTLGMELELEAQEKEVGPFRADIVCREINDESLVLIENQLERTDHTHLGQLMTYAAGLDAVTIVWIAERFTDEHRAAIDWLNEITNEKVSFFGLEIELWQIGNSSVAPKFNVVCKPNDWTRGGARESSGGVVDVSETKQLQYNYWREFRDVLAQRRSPLKPQKALPLNRLTVTIGRANFNLSATVDTNKEHVGVGLNIKGASAKKHFRSLEIQKSQIEAEIGAHLDWRELPTKRVSRILLRHPNTNIKNHNEWPAQHGWLAEMLEKFSVVFKPRILALEESDEEVDDDPM